ncbi:MAG: Nudix hydrolase [Candidatus Aramenus sulfurataquae]|uniref:CoA pyrophosphatase n=2 Tax=Candidatus Aramenus sulfurataquae TaxID=1326980 RepID=W7KUE9_9CREN|nr:MAG: Nudix hydrolase [Candidatus Aramenus sulfurataquae]MBW9140210.1 CoA pyrophosphatase [Candidatus Aramenus sp.]MCL7343637.1 CoA pyrophosphatase [Candidatus Aramenus sulfurataquae]
MDCEAAVVLIVDGKKFLVVKRAERPGDPWSGDMALPGGRVKPGEDCMEAALRECKEEIGFSPEIIGFLGYYSPNNVKVKVSAYLGRYKGEEIRINKDEISAYFWVTKEELIEGDSAFIYKGYRIWGMTYRIIRDYIQSGNDHFIAQIRRQSSLE